MTSIKPKISPKTQEIFQSLREIAVELGPESKLPTVAQLRRDYGVSIATLDTVLARLESQNVITRRQGSGIYVSPYLHKKTVGLVCAPEYFRAQVSPFWSELVEELRGRATLEGEVFRFYLGLPAGRSDVAVHEDLQDDVAARRLDGVFFVGNNPAAIEWIEAQKVAVVNFAGSARYKVEIDYRDLVDQALDVLTRAGRRSIGLMSPFHYHFTPTEIDHSSIARYFREAVTARDLEVCEAWIWDAHNIEGTENQSYQEQGHQAALKLLESSADSRPDGLVVLDDTMTRGALAAFGGANLGPDEMRIVSHSNRGSAVLNGHEAELTLLEIDPREIVRTMFDLLNALMDEQQPAHSAIAIKARLLSA